MKAGLPRIESEGLDNFIPEEEIHRLLKTCRNPSPGRVREVIAKSLAKNRLEPDEMAVLINTEDPELVNEIFEGAR